MMNLEGIDVFIKVIQAGSFTKAAQLLGKPVTTVSDKIAQLEQRLGVTLIHRTTRKLNLTPIGQKFYQTCLSAATQFQEFSEELVQNADNPKGLIRITTAVDVAQTIISTLVRQYLHHYPEMKIEIVVTNEKVDLIKEGIDLALRVGPLSDSTMKSRHFIRTHASLWMSSAFRKKHRHIKNVSDLQELPFIKFKRQPAKNFLLNKNKEKIPLNLQHRIETDDFLTLKKFVLESEGFGILPDFICRHEQKSGELVKIFPDLRTNEIDLIFVYPSQKFTSVQVKSFIDFATKNFNLDDV